MDIVKFEEMEKIVDKIRELKNFIKETRDFGIDSDWFGMMKLRHDPYDTRINIPWSVATLTELKEIAASKLIALEKQLEEM